MATNNTVVQAGMDAIGSAPDTLQQQIPGMTQSPAAAVESIPPYKPYTPPPEPQSRPGSFGWKIAQAIQGFTKAMGDAGNIGQVPEGGGALYGIAKTLQARSQRMTEEQHHKEALEQQARENAREDWRMLANVAHSNVQMRHEQLLTSQLGEEQRDKSIASGQQMADQWTSLPKSQSQVIAENLTSSEIANMIKSKGADGKARLDPARVTAFPTGKKFLGENKDGTPQYATTYTIMSIPAEYELKETDQPWLKIVNSIPGGPQYKAGDRMPGYVANSLFKQAQTIQAQTVARDQALADQKAAEEYTTWDTTGTWAKYLGAADGRIRKAADHFMADWSKSPEMQSQFVNPMKDIQMSYSLDKKEDPNGTKGYAQALSKQDEEDRREREDAETRRHHIESERIMALNKNKDAFDEAGIPLTGEMAARISALPPDKKAMMDKIQDNPLKATLMSIAFSPGEVDFDKVFPNRKYRGTTDISAEAAIGIIRQLNPRWNERQYKVMTQAYDDITKGPTSFNIQQYNNILEHTAAAKRIIDNTWRNAAPKMMLRPLNWLQDQYGNQVSEIRAALAPVRNEFSQLMAGKYAPNKEEADAYQTILNENSRPDALDHAFKIVAATGAIRLENINQTFKRTTGQDIPGLLTKDSLDEARSLGLDDRTNERIKQFHVGDTLFGNPAWESPTPEEVQDRIRQTAGKQAAQRAADSLQQGFNAADAARRVDYLKRLKAAGAVRIVPAAQSPDKKEHAYNAAGKEVVITAGE